MKSLVGVLMITVGLAAISIGLYPWINLWLVVSKQYHYYYVDTGTRVLTVSLIIGGVVMAAFGMYLIRSSHSSRA